MYLNKKNALSSISLMTSLLLNTPKIDFSHPLISVDTFNNEIVSHRHRVLNNSLLIYSEFSQNFPLLSALPAELKLDILHTYMQLHDIPKLMSLEQLEIWGYKDNKTFFEKLYEVYGVDLINKPFFISELNKIEDKIKLTLFKNKFEMLDVYTLLKLLPELKKIEMIADITDTVHMRNLELGVTEKKFNVEKYFENKNDTFSPKIAQWLSHSQYLSNIKI